MAFLSLFHNLFAEYSRSRPVQNHVDRALEGMEFGESREVSMDEICRLVA